METQIAVLPRKETKVKTSLVSTEDLDLVLPPLLCRMEGVKML